MKFLTYCAFGAILMTAALATAPSARAQGLYGDEKKAVTGGELNDQDYWWARFDALMLELAIKQHQPEGRIAVETASSIRRLDELTQKFPNHKEIAQMKARANAVMAQINPDADRNAGFTVTCPWNESNFAQLWVNLHWAKSALDAKDYNSAIGSMQNVMQNYQFMLRPDRMKNYPDDLRAYVVDSKPAADELYKAAKAKGR